MADTKHTTGPWQVDDSIDRRLMRINAGDDVIAELVGHPDIIRANAHLIAGAPELLDLAQRCEPWVTAMEVADMASGKRLEHSQFVFDLHAAIAKATGSDS